jgi:hypothetical protein
VNPGNPEGLAVLASHMLNCVSFCPIYFVIELFVLLGFTSFDYFFGIFKLLFSQWFQVGSTKTDAYSSASFFHNSLNYRMLPNMSQNIHLQISRYQ